MFLHLLADDLLCQGQSWLTVRCLRQYFGLVECFFHNMLSTARTFSTVCNHGNFFKKSYAYTQTFVMLFLWRVSIEMCLNVACLCLHNNLSLNFNLSIQKLYIIDYLMQSKTFQWVYFLKATLLVPLKSKIQPFCTKMLAFILIIVFFIVVARSLNNIYTIIPNPPPLILTTL